MAFKSFVSDSLIAVMEVLFDSLVFMGNWVPNNFSPPNPVEIYNNMTFVVLNIIHTMYIKFIVKNKSDLDLT